MTGESGGRGLALERCGWIMRDMGGRAVTAGRTPQETEDRAYALGVKPLRARIETATPADLDALARKLPLLRLGCEPGGPLWWRNPGPSEAFRKAAAYALDLLVSVVDLESGGMDRDAELLVAAVTTKDGPEAAEGLPLAFYAALSEFVQRTPGNGRAASAPERRPAWLEDVATGEDLAALRRRLVATEDGLTRLATALERRLP